MYASYRILLIFASLLLLFLSSQLMALTAGSMSIGGAEIAEALQVKFGLIPASSNIGVEVVLNLRLPRALSGFACGGLLALAGALMQVLLRNPLADPYVLGISGGAGVGALLAILLGLGAWGINASAFAGAMLAMVLVFGLAHGDGSWTQTRLLLTGVIVASGCGAVVALMLSMAPEQQLRGMLFWLMGDLAQSGGGLPLLGGLLLLLACTLPLARDLNLLARGLQTAQALGVRVAWVRGLTYLLASLATALAVSEAGSIGFIGLVVPHLVRMVLVRLALGNDQRLLLPAAVLAGGSLLTLADTLSRTLIAPQQLPVGVLTALIGVPVFLILLAHQPRQAY